MRGISLRQLTPLATSIVLVPLLIAGTPLGQALSRRKLRLIATAVSVLLPVAVLSTLTAFVIERAEQIATEEQGGRELLTALANIRIPDYRIADASWGEGRLGPVEFHLSGSDLFTGGDYTPEIAAAYPGLTTLNLRVAISLAGYTPPDPSNVGLLKGPVQDLWDAWKSRFPGKPPTGELYSGVNSGVRISHVIYRRDRLPSYTDDTERDLRFTIETLYGIEAERVISAGGQEWTILELATLVAPLETGTPPLR